MKDIAPVIELRDVNGRTFKADSAAVVRKIISEGLHCVKSQIEKVRERHAKVCQIVLDVEAVNKSDMDESVKLRLMEQLADDAERTAQDCIPPPKLIPLLQLTVGNKGMRELFWAEEDRAAPTSARFLPVLDLSALPEEMRARAFVAAIRSVTKVIW